MEKEAGQSDDRPLRIAMVVPPWYEVPPPGYGGLEQVCAALIDGLVARGHDVTLFGCGERTGTRARFVSTGPPQFRRLGELLPELTHVARVNELLERGRFDVIHDHTMAGPLSALTRKAPTVLTMHGCPRGEQGEYFRHLDRRMGLVAISYSQRRLAPQLPWAAVVHHGIAAVESPRTEPGDGPVLWLARFCADKGPELAIAACREAGLPLVLAGKCNEENEKRYLDEVVNPLLGPDVELVVNGDRQTTSELLRRARCLIMPITWEEPFGMVMIEAMALGTPVVALNRGAVPEVVKHGRTGFVCERPEQLPDALRRVGLIDPADCVAHVRDRFSPDLMARGYEQVYRWAIHRTPAVHRAASGSGRTGLAVAGQKAEPLAGGGWPAA
ncbi:MAG TPA: glycosyltransferase family 4 protein [Pilimelia sp.]|nr:glycosyltransferase family 4 protein [Pilimelia sp.]